MTPTDELKHQIKQLFSRPTDESPPTYQQIDCQKQVGGTDCGLFAIANAMEVLAGNDVSQVVFDQTMMRKHLASCFENNKMTPFPKYRVNRSPNEPNTKCKQSDSEWKSPRRSQRLKDQHKKAEGTEFTLRTSNRFVIPSDKPQKKQIPSTSCHTVNSTAQIKNRCKSDIIYNISDVNLSLAEQAVLEKGFNFCPTTKAPNKDRVLDDVYAFTRKLRLKEHFHSENRPTDKITEGVDSEQCEFNMKLRNPYYNPSTGPSTALRSYIAAIKSDVTDLLKRPPNHKSNMSAEERAALSSLALRKDIKIQPADKGGKVVIMNQADYVSKCEEDLANTNFYEKLTEDPTSQYTKEIEEILVKMEKEEMINDNDREFLTEHLECPKTPTFYGLPKIHKSFTKFPPLRPIVSNVDSCTRRISEYLDSFLKFQARGCGSFIRDTKHFLQKLKELNKSDIPAGSILVTMDVAALYTNIDHDEGADACYEKLENRKNKTISSKMLRSLMMLVLKSNAFRFGNSIYKQVKGTCMGTPMAPNYANLFMDRLENNIISSFQNDTGLAPLVWYRYIDDIFFIWTSGEESLDNFIEHAQKYSENQNMKSTIKFEVNKSTAAVNFLDVTVSLKDQKLQSNLYSKPTDAFLYLNKASSHPRHVTNNIPKGQFIRIRRICSEKADYFSNCNRLCAFFVKRGYDSRFLNKIVGEVSKLDRDSLLEDREKTAKDPQMIFVCEWHPLLASVPAILKKHYPVLQNDTKTAAIFPSHPIVAYRRPKCIKNIVVKNRPEKSEGEKPKTTKKCGNCKLCPQIRTAESITNPQKNIKIEIKDGGTCRSKGVVYAAICKKCDKIYVGQTGDQLKDRFSKHRYDAKKRPDNCELADHFHKDHSIDKDMEVLILQSGLTKSERQREHEEDRWICRLQTMASTGINTKTEYFAKEMYTSFGRISASTRL